LPDAWLLVTAPFWLTDCVAAQLPVDVHCAARMFVCAPLPGPVENWTEVCLIVALLSPLAT